MSDITSTVIIIILAITIVGMILAIPVKIASNKGYSFIGVGSRCSENLNN